MDDYRIKKTKKTVSESGMNRNIEGLLKFAAMVGKQREQDKYTMDPR